MKDSSRKQLERLNNPHRPNAQYYIERIFGNFIPLKGDRLYGDDASILSGIALLDKIPVTVIAQLRGQNLNEQVKYNFSMTCPEGFRKALRLMKQAEKFHRPIVCLVDTIGAFPGEHAEAHGQAFAIANNLAEMLFLKVPIVTVLIGYGGSGGALALSIADRVGILENAVFSVISPKAYAEIIWKDMNREEEAFSLLEMTAEKLYLQGIVDQVLVETCGGAHNSPEETAQTIQRYLLREIRHLKRINPRILVRKRRKKYRKMGRKYGI